MEKRWITGLPLLAVGVLAVLGASTEHPEANRAAFREAIRATAEMARDPEANRLAGELGLDVLNVAWEDTGRYKDSSVGPNISDLTIQVMDGDAARCMSLIRYPNFADQTGEIDPRDLTLLVGNHRGAELRRISLRDLLADPTRYLSKPGSWKARRKSLLAERDSRVLVSAQACFLPIPPTGQAVFNPVLFNYQSRVRDPAVLAILATSEGTSMTVIDPSRDRVLEGSGWGQRLFHNKAGRRASLTGIRLSQATADAKRAPSAGMDMVMLIQVPLKQRELPRRTGNGVNLQGGQGLIGDSIDFTSYDPTDNTLVVKGSDVEAAAIGHGELEGAIAEIGDLAIQRDERFPVRVTVQFYKATSNGVVNRSDLRWIKAEIDRVYTNCEVVGSLVTGGRTGRATEYEGGKVQPDHWWDEFWNRHRANTGESRSEAERRLRRLLGVDYRRQPVTELHLREVLQ